MADASDKIPVLLTATQLDLLGEALMEHIPQVADRVSKATKAGTTLEEVSLLKAYLELARIIMDPNNATAGADGVNNPLARVPNERVNGPTYIKRPAQSLQNPEWFGDF